MKKEDKAISQIIGAILLLLIALAILSLVYMYVLSYPLPNPAPYVDIVGSLEEGNITLLHRGGESLDLDTEVRLTIGGIPKNITVGDY
ncbi:MAG: type IV pilin, partial [Thermoplasmatales archaeon]|nr:type IV pilin [Thermoplasmatales archaeon]